MNQDKTYCDFHITCLDGEDCPRKLTAQMALEATREHLELYIYSDKPDCYRTIEKDKDETAKIHKG